MFGIGSTELLVILVVALIVLGPKSLAGVSRALGRAVGEFRRVSTDFQRTLNVEAAEEEAREAAKKRQEAAAQEAAAREAAQKMRQNPTQESGQESARNLAREVAQKSAQTAESGPPPDSPLGQAIAKARIQAQQGSGHAVPEGAPHTEARP